MIYGPLGCIVNSESNNALYMEELDTNKWRVMQAPGRSWDALTCQRSLLRASAAEKIVDLVETEGLKFRHTYNTLGLYSALQGGTLTRLLETLYQDASASPTLSDVKRLVRLRSQQVSKLGRFAVGPLAEELCDNKLVSWRWTHRANVFYPEGSLRVFREWVLGTLPASPEEWWLVRIASNLAAIGAAVPEWNPLRALNPYRAWNPFRYDISRLMRPSKGKIFDLFQSPDTYSLLRREWMKRFFWSLQFTGEDGTRARNPNRSLMDYRHLFSIGVVLSPSVKVKVTFNEGYTTQASIWSLRARPPDIIGIMINPDCRRLRETGALGGRRLTGTYPVWFSEGLFQIPDRVFSVVRAQEPCVANAFLSRLGCSREERHKLLNPESEPYPQELDLRLKNTILEELPFQEGASFLQAITALAERYRLPLYSTDGSLLWL